MHLRQMHGYVLSLQGSYEKNEAFLTLNILHSTLQWGHFSAIRRKPPPGEGVLSLNLGDSDCDADF